jgi:glycosyltransferase involved in cell wall biosynthesis
MADDRDRRYRVAGVAAQSPTMPGFRIRVDLLREELARHGVDVELFLLLTAEEAHEIRTGSARRRAKALLAGRRRLLDQLGEAAAGFDAALIQRQADLLPSLRAERAAADRRRLIWDVDDAIWLDTSREARLHPLAFLKGTRRKVRWLARRADQMIAGNHLLAEWIAQYSDRVTVVPSVVETRGFPVKRHADSDTVTFCWIGSPATARYLAPMRGRLARLRRAAPERLYRLLVVGGRLDPVDGIEIVQLDWSPQTERHALAEADIGLMPIPDTPWTRGKCAYKALQYMAAGLPAVADDVGVTSEVVGEGGVVARNEAEWRTALVELARDPALRGRLGSEARRRVEEHFSVQRWAPVLARIMRGEQNSRSTDGRAADRAPGTTPPRRRAKTSGEPPRDTVKE